MPVEIITISDEDSEQRLDRWFKHRYPGITQGRLQKMLRGGNIRIDGKRVKEAGTRLIAGQQVRVPPLDDDAYKKNEAVRSSPKVSIEDENALVNSIIYKDQHVLVIDKPAGLAVQGGSGTTRHLDMMLGALTLDANERPRLVHRLDKDTSGVLVLARNRKAAKFLGNAFQTKDVRKAYWAIVVGVPTKPEGKIDLPLSKKQGGSSGNEKVWVDEYEGKKAITLYRTIEVAGKSAAWVEMEPITGRTHQLRVHMLALGTPILGDGKYGGQEAFLGGAEIAKQLHLHARAISFPNPGGGMTVVTANLPKHMKETWEYFSFYENVASDPFSHDVK
ncbi:MAG: RluA family pseudouridine synthase [Rhodospirillaceae bacterium]|nr:RluA family pseudouridine synthase [Rhodospirillaceae bacterium]